MCTCRGATRNSGPPDSSTRAIVEDYRLKNCGEDIRLKRLCVHVKSEMVRVWKGFSVCECVPYRMQYILEVILC